MSFPTWRPYRSSSSSALIYSPDSTTEKSPSLLPSVKRLSEDSSVGKAKRKKEDDKPDVQEENQQGIQVTAMENQKEGQNIQVERVKRTSRHSICESLKKQPSDGKVCFLFHSQIFVWHFSCYKRTFLLTFNRFSLRKMGFPTKHYMLTVEVLPSKCQRGWRK